MKDNRYLVKRVLSILVGLLVVVVLALNLHPAQAEGGETGWVVFLPMVVSSPAYECRYNAYNCDDFPGVDAAQTCFNYCNDRGFGDVHYLDHNNDGLACTLFPYPPATDGPIEY